MFFRTPHYQKTVWQFVFRLQAFFARSADINAQRVQVDHGFYAQFLQTFPKSLTTTPTPEGSPSPCLPPFAGLGYGSFLMPPPPEREAFLGTWLTPLRKQGKSPST